MSYHKWINAAGPIAAEAHYRARAVSATPEAYIWATLLAQGYGRARERGVQKSRKGGLSFECAHLDIKPPFLELVRGFNEIVEKCEAPKMRYRVVTAQQSLHTTDISNVLEPGLYNRDNPLFDVTRSLWHYPYIGIADFDPFMGPSSIDRPGSPEKLDAFFAYREEVEECRVIGLRIELADDGVIDQPQFELMASGLISHITEDLKESGEGHNSMSGTWVARGVALSSWLWAETERERDFWNVMYREIWLADVRGVASLV